MPVRRVVIACLPSIEILDVAGPVNVFSAATRLLPPDAGYRVEIAAAAAGPFPTAGGVELVAQTALSRTRGSIDTLVALGSTCTSVPADHVAQVARLAGRSRRIASICCGAFVLGASGLLDGRRVVTHWAMCEELARLYPTCQAVPDAIYLRDGPLWTSAGVTAGLDLALALVEEDHGGEVALAVARWLVMYLRRPGGQTQFSATLAAQGGERTPIRELVTWLGEHLGDDLSVGALARRAGMSERNFARVFAAETGTTPAAHVERLRLEAARRALELSGRPVKEIAAIAGFGAVETMNRAFRRLLRTTPLAYRARFATAAEGESGRPRARPRAASTA